MEHITHIVFINLDKRPDRLKEITEELASKHIVAERYPAVYTPHNGAIGCTESHINILKKARENGWKNVLLLEDDFQFVVDLPKLESSLQHFFNNYSDFDVLLFAYNLIRSVEVDPIIGKVIEAQTTSGYLVNEQFYSTLISTLEEGLALLKTTNSANLYTIDQYWKRIQPQNKWYYVKERIGIQRPGFSDIEMRHVNYNV